MQQDPTFLELTYARLIVYTGSDDPAVVTEATGVVPSQTRRQGDPGRLSPARFGMWELTSGDDLTGVDVDHHVRWVLDQLEPGADALVALLREQREDWRAVLSMYAYMDDINRLSFGLPPQDVARVAALECDLRVGIIIVAGDDHESAVGHDVTEAVFTLGDAEISSEEAVSSDKLADHVAWLLPRARALRDATPEGRARVTLFWARDASNAGITLPAPLVAELAALDAKLFYVLMTAD